MSINKKNYMVESGFTLLELMVALALGLVVSAAALQIFLTSQRSIASQQALSSVQNDAIFGMESIVRDIRMANLNANQPMINDRVLHGGVVLSAFNYTSKRVEPANTVPDITLDEALSDGAAGPSNLQGQSSDVLVIQYRNLQANRFNCEGREIPADTYVVQKYFLREDDNERDDPNNPLSLACIAATYTGDEPAEIDLSGNGQIIIPRVDHFSVMLGVARDERNAACNAAAPADGTLDCFGYISLDNYMQLTAADKPQIVSVKLGALIRSTDRIANNHLFDKDKTYDVINTPNAKLIEDADNGRYMRQLVTQVVALRNGFGIER